MQVRSWLAVALLLGGCSRQAPGTDEAAASTDEAASTTTSESETGETTTTSESETTTANPESSSSEESGPTPDIPDDLPDECVPVNFLDSEDRGGLPNDVWAGWVHCKDSFFRIEAIDCPYDAGYEPCSDPSGCDSCEPTEQCLDYYGTNSGYCFCGNNCTSDSDCGTNEICVCRSGILGSQLVSRNTCLPADCTGQADCAAVPDESVPRCRLGQDLCFSPEGTHCRTEADSCIYDEDCPSQWCAYDPGDELWSCDRPAICE